MASRTWTISYDSSTRGSDVDFGNTVDQHHPVGKHQSVATVYRAFMKFNVDTSGMAAISSAILHMRSTSQSHIAFGADPDIEVRRLTSTLANTTGGSSEGTWASDARPNRSNEPSTTSSGAASGDMTTSNATWDTVNITAIAQAWLAGSTNYGVRVAAVSEASNDDAWEFYSLNSSYDPYVTVTYTATVSNTAPTADPRWPTPFIVADMAYTAGSAWASPRPQLRWTHSDPEGDTRTAYEVIVYNDSSVSGATGAASTDLVTKTAHGLTADTKVHFTTLTGGTGLATLTTYYVISSGLTANAFKVSTSVGGSAVDITVDYSAIVYVTPGTVLYDSGKVITTGVAAAVESELYPPVTFTEGSYYWWKVRVWDSHDLASAYVGTYRFRTRWGAGEYIFDTGSTPTAWGNATVSKDGTVVVEYNSTTATGDPGAGLGTWKTTLAETALQRYVRYRVWLLKDGGTAPSLSDITINYTAASLPTADNWSVDAGAITVDESTLVYGTRSMRFGATGGDTLLGQAVSVRPDTTYLLSTFYRNPNPAEVTVTIQVYDVNVLVTSADSTDTESNRDEGEGWSRIWVSFTTGSQTELYVQLRTRGVTTGDVAWFDAAKLEASASLAPWRPSTVSGAVTLDASGIRIDGSQGGTLRMRGSTGGTRDLIELGSHGIELGGDVDIYSPLAKQLSMGDVSIAAGGTAFPSSPATGDRYWRTDLGIEFYYDGTRWLSTVLYQAHPTGGDTMPLAASGASGRMGTPLINGMSDVYLVRAELDFYVVGGTALSGSHQWVGTYGKVQTGGGGTTTLGTFTINSGTLSQWRAGTAIAIGALMNNGTVHVEIDCSWVKTGTPGNLYPLITLSYRMVAT